MNLKLPLRTAALALAGALPLAAHAETTQCTQIAAVPYAISAPGVYCLSGDLASNWTTGFPIDIQASNVVLDLNGHKLDGSAAGAGSFAVGIHVADQKNVTIRNGTIRGFYTAIGIADTSGSYSNATGNVIEDIRADANLNTGFTLYGSGNVVRNNLVIGTKGAPTALGMMIVGPGARVLNNDVIGTTGGGSTAYGIYLQSGASDVVEGNRVSNTTCPGCATYGVYGIYGTMMDDAVFAGNRVVNASVATPSIGIRPVAGTRMIVSDNRISGYATGINLASSGGMIMNNLVIGATTAYIGGAAAGSTNFSY